MNLDVNEKSRIHQKAVENTNVSIILDEWFLTVIRFIFTNTRPECDW